MRFYPRLISAAAALIVAGAGAALGGNVHLKGGANAEPSFIDGGLILTATGALSGLTKEISRGRPACNGERHSHLHQSGQRLITTSGAESRTGERVRYADN